MPEFHPVTEIFPLMQGEQYDQLVQDIRENDLQELIWLHPDGRIIDGRNRYKACLDADVEPQFRTWNGEGSLIRFVVSLNLHRRHLTSSQRAAAAAEALEQLKVEAKDRQREGGRGEVPQKIGEVSKHEGEATDQAAKMFGTNRTYVAEAAKLKDEDPEGFEDVKRGNIGLATRKRIEEREGEFKWLSEGKEQLVARMKELGLDDYDQLKFARWSNHYDGSANWPGGKKSKWANRVLDLHAEGVPLDKAEDQAAKEHDIEISREREEEKRQEAEKEDREFREREPFEHFAGFLFKIEPLDGNTDYTTHYELIIRHLKNCKLTKLATAVEKMKADWDAEYEQMSA